MKVSLIIKIFVIKFPLTLVQKLMLCGFLFLLLNSSSWLHARNTDTAPLIL